jgi:hypothetical protein
MSKKEQLLGEPATMMDARTLIIVLVFGAAQAIADIGDREPVEA